jgi:hypothetical protein
MIFWSRRFAHFFYISSLKGGKLSVVLEDFIPVSSKFLTKLINGRNILSLRSIRVNFLHSRKDEKSEKLKRRMDESGGQTGIFKSKISVLSLSNSWISEYLHKRLLELIDEWRGGRAANPRKIKKVQRDRLDVSKIVRGCSVKLVRLEDQQKEYQLIDVCPSCKKAFCSKHALNNHIQREVCLKRDVRNSDTNFICRHCNEKFCGKSSLAYHTSQNVCLKRMQRNLIRKSMMNFHTSRKICLKRLQPKVKPDSVCNRCNKKFGTDQSLSYHTERKVCLPVSRPKLNSNLVCRHCKTKFSSGQSLLNHALRRVCLNG